MTQSEKENIATAPNDAKQRVRKSAFWFFVIAALSVVNTFLLANGVYFYLGLAVSHLLDSYFIGVTGSFNMLYSIIAPLIFSLIGFFSLRMHRWAFIVGMLLYFIDAIIYVFLTEWFAVAFHGFILYQVFSGWRTLNQLKKSSI